MKNLIKGTIVLIAISFIFTFAGSLTSCQKATAQTTSNTMVADPAIMFIKQVADSGASTTQLWTMDKTGANMRQIVLPSEYNVVSVVSISDNTTIFFVAKLGSSSVDNVYKCDMSGNNITALSNEPNTTIQIYF